MKAYFFTTAFVAFILISATQQPVEAGIVVPDSGSSGDKQVETLPGLPNYAEPGDEEASKRLRRQQQPLSTTPGQAGSSAYAQPQMPLPPTYAPGAPASYGQPASAGQLPMSPTSRGLYGSPTDLSGRSGFGLPGLEQMQPNQPGSMATQPNALQFPPSPTAPASTGTAADPRFYGPQSPGGGQSTMPQRAPATMQQQQASMSAPSKPFQNYQRKSAYSPYMSLFRYSDMNRGIDNYYNYVQPALEQYNQNSRVDRNITQLQNANRYKYQSLQQINQQNQASQRPGNVIPGANVESRAPATFMNVQQYYPGMK